MGQRRAFTKEFKQFIQEMACLQQLYRPFNLTNSTSCIIINLQFIQEIGLC